MALSDLKITNTDTQNKKISDIEGDTLIGTPADNKAKFDAYCELIKTRFNDLIDSINDGFVFSGGEYVINPSAIQDASSSHKGLMSAEDKAKLDQMLVQVAQVADGVLAPPTSDAVFDAIQTISGIAPDIADYVESFTTVRRNDQNMAWGGATEVYWGIRKWHSGICEVWIDRSKNGDTTYYGTVPCDYNPDFEYLSSENLYYYNLERLIYPDAAGFISAPNEFVSLVQNANAIDTWLVPRAVSSNANRRYGTQAYRLLRTSEPTSSTRSHWLSVYAIGKWK